MKFLLSFVLFCLSVAPAFADAKVKNIVDADLPKLDRNVGLTKEQFEANTNLIQDTPLKNQSLAFSVRLPKAWTKLEVKGESQDDVISGQLLGDVAQYLGPPSLDIRGVFRIRANNLAYDISARDWFLTYIYSNNFNLQGFEFASDKRAQAQYITVENGVQNIVRAVVQVSGSRLVLAEYICPVELWDIERDYAIRAMSTFMLTNPDVSPIELMPSYSFVDIAKFNYPASWILSSPPITSIERMNASLTNLRGGAIAKRALNGQDAQILDGRIDISVVTKNSETNIAHELDEIKKQMLIKGLVLGDLIEPVEGWPHNDAIIFSKVEAYKVNNVKNKLSEYEQWIGVFETSGRYYFLRLLTVGRNDDFLTWSRNVRAYKKVVASLSPVTG